jgi:hypothetical protein
MKRRSIARSKANATVLEFTPATEAPVKGLALSRSVVATARVERPIQRVPSEPAPHQVGGGSGIRSARRRAADHRPDVSRSAPCRDNEPLCSARVQTAVHRSGRRASNAVPARVLAEGTRHLVRRGAPAQLRYLPVLEGGRAINGILQSFEHRLQTLDASLKGRDPGLRTDRLGAWRFVARALRCHCSGPPRLYRIVAREEEETRPDERTGWPPRLESLASSPAPPRDRASATFKL